VVTHSPQLFYASLYKFLQLSRLEVVRTNHPVQFHRSANASLSRVPKKPAAPTQPTGVAPDCAQTKENDALVYDVQKSARAEVQKPDPGARLGRNIRKAKGGKELSDFSRHRSFLCTLPLLMNNPKPALLRRSVGGNFRVIGARLICMILPTTRMVIGEGFQSADLSEKGRAQSALFEPIPTRPTPSNRC
jgi:hypothetical protein